MKTLKIFLLPALLTILACQENTTTTTAETATRAADPDQLLQRWDEAWNQNNIDSLQNLLADDAVLLMEGEEYSTSDINDWMRENSQAMRDLKTEAKVKRSTGDVAYQAGTYSHGLKENDTLEFNGTFTFVWERQNDDEWKVRLMDINQRRDTTEMDQQ